MENVIKIAACAMGSIISYSFGGMSGVLEFLLICLALDYLSGVAAAFKHKELQSEIGFWGLIKKVLMLLAVMLAHRADVAFALDDVIMTGMIWAFLVNELISIAENYGRLGLPLSQHLQPLLAALQRGPGGKQ